MVQGGGLFSRFAASPSGPSLRDVELTLSNQVRTRPLGFVALIRSVQAVTCSAQIMVQGGGLFSRFAASPSGPSLRDVELTLSNQVRTRPLGFVALIRSVQAVTCSAQIMVQGGGFEPPKLARQIYSLIPLATREPLRKEAGILRLTLSLVNHFFLRNHRFRLTTYEKMELARGVEPPTG